MNWFVLIMNECVGKCRAMSIPLGAVAEEAEVVVVAVAVVLAVRLNLCGARWML